MNCTRAFGAMSAVAALAACAQAPHGSTSHASVPTSARIARIGQPAPPWTESAVPGGSLSSTALAGKAVYLNFFATWCPPCNDEAPALDALQRQYADRGLQVVGVDVLENAGKAAQFRKAHHLTYPAVVDDGTLRNQYAVNGLPVHVFIDRTGVVRNIVVGQISTADMRADVLKLLR